MARKKSQTDLSGAAVALRRVPMREFSRSLPMSLLRAREAVMRQFRPSLREHGLTEQQWRILRALAAKTDLRRAVVSISEKGLKLMERVAPTSEEIYAAITRRFGARRLAELQEMLSALERSLGDLGFSDRAEEADE
jgi:DNA-binding MarR family transcriptional regulator